MTRRLLNRKIIAALCGPGPEYVGQRRWEWPMRALWDRSRRPARPRLLRMIPGKRRGEMNQYQRAK